MSHRFLTDPARFPALRGILRTHELTDSGNYYHEVLTPFQFTLMSIRPAAPERNTLTILTPGACVSLPPLPPALSDGLPGMHHHNCYEFTYVLEGSLYQLVNGKRFYYPAGSCCLMNRNTLHAEEDATDYCCVFLSLTEAFFRRLLDPNSLFFPQEQAACRGPILDFIDANRGDGDAVHRDFLDFLPSGARSAQQERVHALLSQLAETLIDPPPGASFRLMELMSGLIALLTDKDSYQLVHVTAETNLETLLLSRIDRLLSQRRGRITNRELAELLHYNGSYLGRIVKKHTGKSLFDYSMDVTMAAAAELLRESKRPVSEIASELRFTNLSHFYSIFRAHFGTTPAEYRAAAKTGTP